MIKYAPLSGDSMDNLRIVSFDSIRRDGQMSKKLYPNDLPNFLKMVLLKRSKQRIMDRIGLDYKNILIPTQKDIEHDDLYEDGYCYIVDNEDINKYDDLYDFDLYADIIKLTPETRNIAVAYPIADCAVVKVFNTKTNEVTLSHCGGKDIDKYLPVKTIDALNCNEKDIKVYVSPFAYKLIYNNPDNLRWANNPKVWKGCIRHSKDGSVSINIYKALKKQLLDRKIKEENLFISEFDTIKSDMFFSNAKGYIDETFKGRFLSGIAFLDNNKRIEETPYIKIIK